METTSVFRMPLGFLDMYIHIYRSLHLYINIPTQMELPDSKKHLEITRCIWIGKLMFGNLMRLFWWINEWKEEFMTEMTNGWVDERLKG